jgi:hypothetical protein
MQILNLGGNSGTEEEGKHSAGAVPVTGEKWLQRIQSDFQDYMSLGFVHPLVFVTTRLSVARSACQRAADGHGTPEPLSS